jgi:hypothetical protein
MAEALDMAIEVIKGSDEWDLDQILAEFEAQSGVLIREAQQ